MRVRTLLKSLSVLFLSLPLLPLFLLGQEQKVQYTPEEYQAYTEAVKAGPDAIVEFIRTNPRSALVEYALGSYLEVMQQKQKEGKPAEVVALGEKILSVQPGEPNALYMSTVAAYQSQQFPKAVQYGEKIYPQKPSAGLAFILANSYGQIKNQAKYVEYGEKACRELAPKECYQILGELTRIYAGKQQWRRAAGFARKAIEGFNAASKPPQSSEAEWKEYVNRQKAVAYAVLGRQAAERESWGRAIRNYQKTLKLYSTPALNGEAYYYIGMGRWKQNEVDPAMEAFARGSLQRGAPHAKACRHYLETLYRSTHNDSLAGIDEFVDRFKRH